MLTWITFPCYVVLFSLLIYFIGYKLRAGETEWNELHLVDVLANGSGAELARVHLRASIYSPVNATYRVERPGTYTVFRGEFQSAWAGGGQDGERADVLQYRAIISLAQISVPVWTSQLYVSDWWQSQPDQQPLSFKITADSSDWSVVVTNLRDHPLTNARLAVRDRIIELSADLPAKQSKTFKLPRNQGEMLPEILFKTAPAVFKVLRNPASRHSAAAAAGAFLICPTAASLSPSFPIFRRNGLFHRRAWTFRRFWTKAKTRVLLAWEDGYSPIKPLNQFSARRGHKDTLWRVSVPINAP